MLYTLLACTFIFMAYIGFVVYHCSPGLGWRVHLRETAAQMKTDKDEQCTQEFCPPYLCGGQGGEAKVSSLAWV